jgi:hypothetical protein
MALSFYLSGRLDFIQAESEAPWDDRCTDKKEEQQETNCSGAHHDQAVNLL